MLNLIAEYIVINHKFGVAKQEAEYVRNDHESHYRGQPADGELIAMEEEALRLFYKREEVIEELEKALINV